MIKATENITVKQLAELSGVSLRVVTEVLSGRPSGEKVRFSEKTRQRVLETADKHNYRPNRSARNFVNKRHGCIALVTESIYYFSRTTLNSLTINAMENDSMVLVDRVSEEDGVMPRCLEEDMADGVVIFGHISEKINRQLDELKIPTVRINTNRTKGNGVITFDERGGMKMLVEAFAKRGRKKIAMLHIKMGGGSGKKHYSQLEREKALRDFSREFGLEETTFKVERGELLGNALTNFLKENPDVDALITEERYLPKLYDVCRENGRIIGQDISILCYQPEWNAGLLNPVCGGVSISDFDLGEKAVLTMTEIINGKQVPTQVVPYELKTGNSL